MSSSGKALRTWMQMDATVSLDDVDTTATEPTPGGPSDAEDSIPLGKIIDGRYLLLAKLGEGGMGSVFRVEHVRMNKIMALKLLRPDVARKRSAVERFRREAQVV